MLYPLTTVIYITFVLLGIPVQKREKIHHFFSIEKPVFHG